MQVIVKDKSGKPVPNVLVTFTILAGGGTFADGAMTVTAKTGEKGVAAGVAAATPVLGRKTGDNPTYFIEEDDTYSSQYGVNIINASMESGTEITAPFTAYGYPKTAVNLRKTSGDDKTSMVLSYSGFVGLVVEDEYGNPISNQSVTFSVGNVKDNSGCTKDAKDTRPAVLIKGGDSCLDNFLTYSGAEKCNPAAQTMDVISDHQGASVGVLLGGMPGSVYPVVASAIVETESGEKELNATFNLQTFAFSRCGGGQPRYYLFTTYVYPTDMYGNNINAGRTDTEVTLKARMYYIKEDETTYRNSMTCDGFILPCDNWIKGAGTFHDFTDVKNAILSFGNIPGNYQNNGEFTATYKLQRGLNNITITGKADIGYHVNVNNCQNGCRPLDEKTDSPPSTPVVMQLYGVDIDVKQPLQVALTPDGYSRNNLKIAYTIAPADYQAVSADILIYKGDEVIDYLLSESKGGGFGTIARGYKFDPAASYYAEVVLNYGMGNKISSGKVPINIVKGFLVTDYNHNRKIDQEDIDEALNSEIYNFWVNDDDDSGDTDGTDIPGSGSNGTSEKISGVRDLIDYFPVHLDIKYLLSKYDPSQYIYKLSCDKENVNYVVPVNPLLASRTGEYLTGNDTDLTTATSLVDGKVKVEKRLVPKEGTTLPADFLAAIQGANDSDHGVILLDGRSIGQCNLKLSVLQDGKSVFESAPLVINLSGVEDMFRHVNLTSSINNPSAPAIETGEIGEHKAKGGEKNRAGEPVNFSDSNTDRKYFVMLYGFKVDGQAARGWHSEMFKRLYWSGSRARFVGVSWFGFENVPDYQQNVLNAFRTASVFGNSLFNVTGNAPVTIMAHSLGSMVVSSYLNDYHLKMPVDQRPNIINYLMINAAVALEAYLGDYQQYSEGKLDETFSDDDTDNPMVHTDWHGYQKRFAASEWHQFFSDDTRKTISWRKRFGNMPDAINYYSFYSTGEDVLGTHIGTPGLIGAVRNALLYDAQYAWAYQEKWKGRGVLFEALGSTPTMGWGFNLLDKKYNPSDELQNQKHLDAATANSTIDNTALKKLPFFNKFIPDGVSTDLFDTTAIVDLKQNFALESLLAKGIPALTLPTGGWKGGDVITNKFIIGNRIINMNDSANKNGWPSSRENENWRHNDIKKVSFLFTKNIFNSIVNSGGLK